ncbi:hypothetical protein Cni_G28652 [Canna indica]|uniref:RING-type E3 ubiquitin transferase n=1 Tax=Canna indica TaxID=4628 RepID=A0AAQ3L499_9LILI|nr:hypothetical protein Cni_G28652 [Canna indica]
MGSRKLFWRFSGHRLSSSSASDSSPTSSITSAEMPVEFLCPISCSLMADPVIVPPSGHTFERSCIQACADLAFSPPGLSLDLNPSSLLLIPNVALKSAIISWCQRSGIPPPQPLPPEAARALVRRLIPPSAANSSPFPSALRSHGASVAADNAKRNQRGEFVKQFAAFTLVEATEVEKDETFRSPPEYGYRYGGPGRAREETGNFHRAAPASSGFSDGQGEDFSYRSTRPGQNSREATNPKTASAFSVPANRQAPSYSQLSISSVSSHQSTSSNSSTEVFIEEAPREVLPPAPQARNLLAANPPASPTADIDVSEEEILIKLMNTELSKQQSAVVLLRQATRESRNHRVALCTPRLLAALRSMIRSSNAAIQISAAAALVNLSLERDNRVRIVRSGAVPPLVEVLKSGQPEARDHAAGSLFSLALEEENRAAIGVLGAITPLLNIFCVPSANSDRARRDAGMALYYLSLAVANRSKIARAQGGIRALLTVASEGDEAPPMGAPPQQGPGLARLAMMIVCNLAGCNEGRAALMDGGAVASVVSLMKSSAGGAEEYCVAALYGMSRGSLRFRGLARSAGAERVLMRVAEGSGGIGEMRREMAKKTIRAMRGEEEEDSSASSTAMAFPTDDDGSIVSEGMMSIRRRHNHYSNPPRMNSAEF